MEPTITNPQHTCLHQLHCDAGAHMVDFAGWHMPLFYSSIEDEHEAVRTGCGVFDITHMGEISVCGKDAERFINAVFTNDASHMKPGDILYGMMLNDEGGVIDDMILYKVADEKYFFVVNASNCAKDFKAMMAESVAYNDVKLENISDTVAAVAVQGPRAEEVIGNVLGIDVAKLDFYKFCRAEWEGHQLLVSRTGYTGEDGFEIYASTEVMPSIWRTLTDSGKCIPCGLGSRDTLRFEAGLPLYGNELDDDTTPLEAGLGIFVKLDKPMLIGRCALIRHKEVGLPKKLVGLELNGAGIARHGYPVLDANGKEVGRVTTGYLSPTLGKSVAMAYVDTPNAAIGTQLQVQIRRRAVPATVVKRRFYVPKYKK